MGRDVMLTQDGGCQDEGAHRAPWQLYDYACCASRWVANLRSGLPQVIDVEFPLYLRYQVSQHHDEPHEVGALIWIK